MWPRFPIIIMTNDIEIQKLKSEYLEFFEQVSPELLKIIFSEETSSKIAEICLENGVENEEKIEKIAYRVALALLGQIPKENLAEILEKGVKLNHETAGKISIQIKRFIFSQIQETQPEKTQPTQPTKRSPLIPELVLEEEKPEKLPPKDTYQEPIE